nr:integrase, catalytic region, zinc finger, CCHC-type, peptidase aspartic, catalytic [Tanacetum cinerariifolium]
MKTVTILKNDFKKEESRNIDREIALEKKIKNLDNIVYKRDQSAQTVHMLTKPKFFYDHTTKQALGFQNLLYLKKAKQLEPKLYDGNVIKNTCAIVILDSEETLMLPEDNPTPSNRSTKVEVPKELPKFRMHSKLNANSELICVKCNGCMLSDNHDMCVPNFNNDVNAHAKSIFVKKNSKGKVWKPTEKVFTKIGYIWRPIGRTFTIVGNACPLTRITTTTVVPSRKPVSLEIDTPKPVVTLVFSKKPRQSKTTDPVRNLRVYYVEGLGHNLSSVGQFCDSNHEVDFRQHTCYIHNLEGVDLLTGSRGNNLYTLSLGDMMASSPI